MLVAVCDLENDYVCSGKAAEGPCLGFMPQVQAA
jgi:hypothetical protein